MKEFPQIETPADHHEVVKSKRRQRLAMLATYRTEGGIHDELDARDEADRLVRGVLGRGQ